MGTPVIPARPRLAVVIWRSCCCRVFLTGPWLANDLIAPFLVDLPFNRLAARAIFLFWADKVRIDSVAPEDNTLVLCRLLLLLLAGWLAVVANIRRGGLAHGHDIDDMICIRGIQHCSDYGENVSVRLCSPKNTAHGQQTSFGLCRDFLLLPTDSRIIGRLLFTLATCYYIQHALSCLSGKSLSFFPSRVSSRALDPLRCSLSFHPLDNISLSLFSVPLSLGTQYSCRSVKETIA